MDGESDLPPRQSKGMGNWSAVLSMPSYLCPHNVAVAKPPPPVCRQSPQRYSPAALANRILVGGLTYLGPPIPKHCCTTEGAFG